MGKWQKKWLAGTLAMVLSCTTLLSGGSAAFAASGRTNDLQKSAAKTDGEKGVQAEDLEIVEGEDFDIKQNFTGISIKDKSSIVFKESTRIDTETEKTDFDVNKPGQYNCVYMVVPVKGEAYEISRTITVKARESETKGQNEKHTEDVSDEEDGEADPQGEVVADPGVLLSVVPAAFQNSRASATLVKGYDIYYPGDLGNYLTCRFSVNGKIAYCIESNKASPPSADYVADIYESNIGLQKVLYYGYGGPGDLSGEYYSGYDDDLRYVLTHLAASFSYAGEAVAFTGCYESGIAAYRVREYINYLYSQEAPPTAAISLSSTHEKAYLEGDIQRSKEMTLSGDHRNYITLSLPEKVTYHNTSGGEQAGGSIKIYGGTSFYFTAPKTVSGTWESGILEGQMGSQWKTLVVSTGGASQDIGYGDFYEESSDSVNFSVKWMDIAWIKIIKADADTKVNLSGAVFGLYSDKGCTKLITEMPKTDNKGASEVEFIMTQKTVYLKEITSPIGYKLNTSSFNVNLEAGKTQTVDISNKEQKGKIVIYKSGERLTGAKGEPGSISFAYSAAAFEKAEYKIYAAENIVSQDKKTVIHKSGDLVQELVTGADGSTLSKDLYLGKYKVVEKKAPDSLTIGKTEEEKTHFVALTYGGQTVELVKEETKYVNNRPEVKVQIVKKSTTDDVTLKGAVFGLYAAEDIKTKEGTIIVKKDTLIEKVISDVDGNAVFKADIPIDFHYYVEEIQAPTFYYESAQKFEFFYEYKNDVTYSYKFEHTFKNKEVRGEVHVSKIDKDSQDYISQGDANMENALYGLYAAEDINYPNGKSGLVHKKDELVAQGNIKKGKVDFKNLYLGKYYVKEIEPGDGGYLLDETAYPVEVGYEGQEIEIVHRNVTVKETVKKQAFELIKISEDGNQTETDLVENAGFKIYLISTLKGVLSGSVKPSNGSEFTPEDFIGYDYSKDETASYYENGKKVTIEELFTDKKGYLKSPELPYGKYVIFESTTPKNLQTVNPFLVTVDKDSREPQPWRIFDDRPIQFYFKIVKEDAQTNLPVLNNSAKYKIYDVSKKKYVTMKVRYPEEKTIDVFETNKEGYLVTPEQLHMGTYRIEEVEAPNLFVQPGSEMVLMDDKTSIPLNQISQKGTYKKAGKEVITVTVDSNTAHEVEPGTGKYIVVVRQKNDEAVGSLTIKKTGEFLRDAKSVSNKVTQKAKNILAGAVNKVSDLLGGEEIIEKEEGYAFSYETGPAAGVEFSVYAREVIYSPDGQLDAEGNQIIRYAKDALVTELTTKNDGTATVNNLPVGLYYLKETKAADNSVLDQEEKDFEIAYNGQDVAVDYVSMELHNERQKIELEIVKSSKETKEAVEGALFGLYAEEDIVNTKGDVLVEKGSIIAKAKSDAEGKVEFGVDLPHGKYYMIELEPAPGYLPSDEKITFDATYTDSKLQIISLQAKIENQPTVVEISKTDITDEKELPGATLQIQTEDGKTIEEWTSTEVPHKVYALAPGKYILHEEAAPQGYLIVSDVPFEVQETGEVQKVSMKDERPVGQLLIKKTDAESKTPLKGVEFELRNKATKEVIEKLVTGDDGIAKSKEIPTALYENGKYVEPIVYVLVETKPLEGYESNAKEEEVVFNYVDDKTKVIEVSKEITNQRLPGIEAPKTGDTTNIWIPIILVAISVLGIGILVYRIKRKRQK